MTLTPEDITRVIETYTEYRESLGETQALRATVAELAEDENLAAGMAHVTRLAAEMADYEDTLAGDLEGGPLTRDEAIGIHEAMTATALELYEEAQRVRGLLTDEEMERVRRIAATDWGGE